MAKTPKPYEVGYGKPPESTRFKKGHTGHGGGRPKGSVELATLVQKIAREVVTVQENGTRKRIPKIEAAIKQPANRATTGDQRAIKLIADLMNLGVLRPLATSPSSTSPTWTGKC